MNFEIQNQQVVTINFRQRPDYMPHTYMYEKALFSTANYLFWHLGKGDNPSTAAFTIDVFPFPTNTSEIDSFDPTYSYLKATVDKCEKYLAGHAEALFSKDKKDSLFSIFVMYKEDIVWALALERLFYEYNYTPEDRNELLIFGYHNYLVKDMRGILHKKENEDKKAEFSETHILQISPSFPCTNNDAFSAFTKHIKSLIFPFPGKTLPFIAASHDWSANIKETVNFLFDYSVNEVESPILYEALDCLNQTQLYHAFSEREAEAWEGTDCYFPAKEILRTLAEEASKISYEGVEDEDLPKIVYHAAVETLLQKNGDIDKDLLDVIASSSNRIVIYGMPLAKKESKVRDGVMPFDLMRKLLNRITRRNEMLVELHFMADSPMLHGKEAAMKSIGLYDRLGELNKEGSINFVPRIFSPTILSYGITPDSRSVMLNTVDMVTWPEIEEDDELHNSVRLNPAYAPYKRKDINCTAHMEILRLALSKFGDVY